jgi:queuine tRNA-ribosyltransferase
MGFKFEILARDPSGARLGRLTTARGVVDTPAFMPVGTAGTVKGLTQAQLEELGVQILLGNTYHLYLRPGHEVIRSLGGLHRFMSWPHPILTDSGGYQVFSLAELRRVNEEGVRFRSHLDGSEHLLTPEKAVEIQMALGSDICMVLDECIELPAERDATQRAARRTVEWAARSRDYLARHGDPARQMQFGIVQGGAFEDLRRENADELVALHFPGYSLGGLAVGEPHHVTCAMTAAATSRLPAEKPRYLMGVGYPEDIPDYVMRGIDMMDCVLPTRNARNGMLFTSQGRLNIKNAPNASDSAPADENCACPVCRRYSRAYLRHLYMSHEILAAVLNSTHNLYFYLDLMRRIRAAIAQGALAQLAAKLRRELGTTSAEL